MGDISPLLITASASSVFLLLLMLTYIKRLRAMEAAFVKRVLKLEKDLQILNSGSVGVGKRVLQLERKLNLTAEKQEELEHKDFGGLAFNHANKMLDLGAEPGDLVVNCGLSKAEAELVSLLHHKKSSFSGSEVY